MEFSDILVQSVVCVRVDDSKFTARLTQGADCSTDVMNTRK